VFHWLATYRNIDGALKWHVFFLAFILLCSMSLYERIFGVLSTALCRTENTPAIDWKDRSNSRSLKEKKALYPFRSRWDVSCWYCLFFFLVLPNSFSYSVTSGYELNTQHLFKRGRGKFERKIRPSVRLRMSLSCQFCSTAKYAFFTSYPRLFFTKETARLRLLLSCFELKKKEKAYMICVS
jgi:hypothetical protein